jgi:hypothetical protein
MSARTGRSKLRRKGQAAIAALLTEPTHAAAAAKAGISEATLHRWLRRPRFLRSYRAARRRVVELAVSHLQQGSVEAVDALRRGLKCGNPLAEIRAAQLVLEQAFRGAELLDLVERVEELERQAHGGSDGNGDGDAEAAGAAAGGAGEDAEGGERVGGDGPT